MEKLTFEPAGPENVAEITAILNAALAYKVSKNDFAWGDLKDPFSANEVSENIEEMHMYVVRIGDEAAATFALDWEDANWGENRPSAGYIHRLAVADNYRGQGLSAQIVDWAAEQVRAEGREYLRLDCDADNESLCALYEKLGFMRVSIGNEMTEGNTRTTAYFEKTV